MSVKRKSYSVDFKDKLFIKFIARSLGWLDRLIIVPLLDFETYFNLHEKLGFPIKKLYFFYVQGYQLNLDNPVTFNEKVIYRQLFDRDPFLSMIVDKYLVREYVKEKIGEEYLIPLLQIAKSFDEIDFAQLPDKYIMKMNHASGQNVIINKGKMEYPFNKKKLKKTFETWFTEKYRFHELIWFEQNIKRQIIIEKLLLDENEKVLKDYKFFVFDGNVEFILVVHDRFGEHSITLYDRDWNVADFVIEDTVGDIEKVPKNLKKMIAIAEKLAFEFTAMRVDLYTYKEKIYFGELTPCHGGAFDKFIPVQYDEYYGNKWKNHISLMRKL